ncbi:hypothetical protein [Actinacidiphila glaucinigra]|uniref:hypothetical protein n=1 Tax=Actinacidiphila glaucinigra TaxID=235986 RepID=UPI00366D7EBD
MWFFPLGMDQEVYGALRGSVGGRGRFRRREDRRADRDVLDAAGVAGTTGAPSPSARQLADEVVATGRAADAAIRLRGLAREEEWEARARIAGRTWLGVHLPDGTGGLPDEERTDQHACVGRIRDDLRALAAGPGQ